jgi:hypothetical protein
MFEDIATHFLIGIVFALTGVYARQWCKHLRHQITVGLILVALEAVIMVMLVG